MERATFFIQISKPSPSLFTQTHEYFEKKKYLCEIITNKNKNNENK